MNTQPKVLIIDEQSDDRYLLIHFLRYCEFEVKECSNINVNLVVGDVEEFSPDVVVLSERSKPLDGYQLCPILHKICGKQEFRTILLVDEMTDLTKTLAQRNGINEIVPRPSITDKEYSYFKIIEYIHKNIISVPVRKNI